MMTDSEIKSDLFKLIKESELARAITGKVYKRPRPQNSKKEDCVIRVIANENGEIQTAIAIVNIYIPDVFVEEMNEWTEDDPRIAELSKMAEQLFNHNRTLANRLIELQSQQTFEETGKEHFVSNRILFNIYNP